jgi:hypothetical protein
MPRKTYTVDFPDGHSQSFDGPVGMSNADAIARAKQERGIAGGDIPSGGRGGLFSQAGVRDVLEHEPQTVNAILGGAAGLTGPAAPYLVGATPYVTSGLKRLSQFLATGHADPVTPGEVVGDTVQAAIGVGGGPALAKGAQLVRQGKGVVQAAASELPGWMRSLANLGGKASLADAATSKYVMDGVGDVGRGITPANLRGTFGNVIKGLTPGLEEEAAPGAGALRTEAERWRAPGAPGSAASEAGAPAASGDITAQADRWRAGRASRGIDAEGGLKFDRYGGSTSGFDPAGGFGEAAQPFESGLDRLMPNKSGFDPAGGFGEPAGTFDEGLRFDRYGGQRSGYNPAEAALQRAQWTEAQAAGAAPGGAAADDAAEMGWDLSHGDPSHAGSLRVIDDAGGAATNASGESAASLEALRRQAGMTGRGEGFSVVDRGGASRPLIGPDAVDYVPKAGETFGVQGPDGFQTLTDNGGRVVKQQGGRASQFAANTPEARAARAAARDVPAVAETAEPGEATDALDVDDAEASLRALLDAPSFRALRNAATP